MKLTGKFATLTRAGAFALPLLVLIAAPFSSRADETQAREIFKAMSDYVSGQKVISFDYDSSLELVTREGQKVAFTSSGSVTLDRPDKIRATRAGGFANVELVFDGKTLSLLGKEANVYTQVDIPGSIDHLVDELRDTYHRPMPAADLLMSDPYGQLMPLVTDVKDLGSGFIRGEECDHLAFRTEEADFQLWVARGERPYPCRYVITAKKVEGWPQYAIDVRDWKAGDEVGSDDFGFAPPSGATLLKPEELPGLDELPGELVKGLPQ